jgi:hypothetical protein
MEGRDMDQELAFGINPSNRFLMAGDDGTSQRSLKIPCLLD